MNLKKNSKDKNIRDVYMDINGFKKGYQPTTDIVKDDKSDQVADTHRILSSWRNNFLSYLIYMESILSARLKNIQQRH